MKRSLLALRSSGILRLVAYAFGQAIGYGTDLLIFLVLMTVRCLDLPIVAHLCGKCGSAALTYFYHARFSFPGEKANSLSASTVAYVVMVLVNMAWTSFVLKGLVWLFPQHVLAAKVVSDVVGVLLTYLLMRTLVFPRMES